MTVEVPPFDTDALRDNVETYPEPPADPVELARIWQVFRADQLAASEQIDLMAFALRGVAA